MITTDSIKGINLPLLAKPIKTNAYQIGNINNIPNVFFKIKNHPKYKKNKNKKRKKFADRIKDIENNYLLDMKNNSYLMSYGYGAIGF